MVREVDKFLAAVLPLQHEADTALHTGDAKPRKALWSTPRQSRCLEPRRQ